MEPSWNRVSKTRFVIILTSSSRLQNILAPKHTNPNLRQAQTLENPSANPSAKTSESHWRQKTNRQRQVHLISDRKPIDSKKLSSPLIDKLSLKTSLSSLTISHWGQLSTIFYHYSYLFIIKPHQSTGNFVFPSFPYI